MQIRAVALEKFVRRKREENIEIARRAALHTGFAFTGQTNARAVLDALRNVDRQRAVFLHAALSGA